MIEDVNNKNIQEGTVIHGFQVKRISYLEKLNNHFYELEHEKTGARYIHLSNDDDNNCFSIAFKTNPQDLTKNEAHLKQNKNLQYLINEAHFFF